MSLKEALVTGGTGYIGSRLVRSLLKKKIKVHVLVRQGSSMRMLQEISDELFMHEFDGSYSSVEQIYAGNKIDVTFHLAANWGYDHSAETIGAMIKSNIEFGSYLLEAMSQHGSSNLINTGTFWEKSDSDSEHSPICYYAATKSAFRKIIDYYVLDRKIAAVTLMLYEVYGKDDPRGKIFSVLTNALREESPIDVTASEQEALFVHIDDVIEAYIASVPALREGQHLEYSVAPDETYTLREVIEKFIRQAGGELRINWGSLPYRRNQIMHPVVGQRVPGWRPNITIEEGINRLLA